MARRGLPIPDSFEAGPGQGRARLKADGFFALESGRGIASGRKGLPGISRQKAAAGAGRVTNRYPCSLHACRGKRYFWGNPLRGIQDKDSASREGRSAIPGAPRASVFSRLEKLASFQFFLWIRKENFKYLKIYQISIFQIKSGVTVDDGFY